MSTIQEKVIQNSLGYYDRALAIDPNYADAREHKALVIEKLGEKE